MPECSIRAIVFDAVGTLLHPVPAAAAVYAEVGRRFGCQLEMDGLRRAFREAVARQDALDAASSWRTSEMREMQRWQSIVRDVLPDGTDPQACFAALYEHFSQPDHWQCDPAAQEIFAAASLHNIKLGLASNFDRRLRRVVAGFPVLAATQHIIISSEVGWRKPAPEFFAAVCQTLETAPQEVLHIGDDQRNDYQGALDAGCHAVLFDPDCRLPARFGAIRNLKDAVDCFE
jgi:putative hydrolase of the HAD superfamily